MGWARFDALLREIEKREGERIRRSDFAATQYVLLAFAGLACALLGFPVAYYMARYTSGKTRALFYVGIMLPLWSSYLVRVYAWKLILAKEGVISWLVDTLGLDWLLDAILSLPVIGGPSLSVSTLDPIN